MRIKLLIFIVALFIVFTSVVHAADVSYQVTGKVFDSDNNNVPNTFIAFDDANGKVVASVTTSQDGSYLMLIPKGTYTVNVKAPIGINAPEISNKGQIISANTNINFTLKTPVKAKPSPTLPKTPKKSSLVLYSLMAIVVVVILALGFYLFRKNNKVEVNSVDKTS